ncbi:cache domain-containing protein, partial [Campylobacter jejuni]|nr:cache domain-containing protein [Campylobacter jejuni]
MKSVKIRLSIVANLIAVFALIFLGVVSFFITRNSLYEITIKNQSNVLQATQNVVIDFRKQNFDFIKNLENEILNLPNQDFNSEENLVSNVGLILRFYRHNMQAYNVFLVLENGKILLSQPSDDNTKKLAALREDFNVNSKEWYQNALNDRNNIAVSPAYIDANLKEYVITYAKSIYKDGKFIGVLGIDIPAKKLQKSVADTPGNTFVFNEEGKIFSATDQNLLQPTVDLSPVFNAYKINGDYKFFTYESDKGVETGTCAKAFSYTACITQSINDINEPIYKIAFIQAIIVIVVIAFSVV